MNLPTLCLTLLSLILGAGVSVQGQAGRRGDVADANSASERQLLTLPGMTPALATGILERRPFLTMTDFDAWLGQTLSREQRTEMYRRLFVQINLNTAPDAEMLLIPGLEDRIPSEIKALRPYRALAQFRRGLAKSLNDKEAVRIEQYVFVPINLNSATDADILSIPGMGQRMLREFKEYRPYKAIQQFRREIGKYVDDKEVARLERYVTVN